MGTGQHQRLARLPEPQRENASWFFNFSQPGDIVEIRNTGGPGLQIWQNGDWTIPWAEWLKGSALTPSPWRFVNRPTVIDGL